MDELVHIDALDSFLGLIKEALPAKTRDEFKTQQKRELELWHTWNTEGRKPEHLQPLYEAYKPFIAGKSRIYTNRVEMPTSAIEAEFKKHFVHAVKTFNPGRGAQLNTWVDYNLRKASRYVKTYQNMGKIPERQIANIRKFDEAKFELTQKHGSEPDVSTLADHLGWPTRRVMQMQKERRKDLPTSGFEHGDPTELLSPKELEAINLLQYDSRLNHEDRAVYEYTFGMNGKPTLKPGEISKKTGLHPSKISRIRNKLKGLTQEVIETI